MSFYSKYSGEQIDNILTSIIEGGNKNNSSISIVNGYEELDPEAEIGSFALVRNVEEVQYVCELKDYKNSLEITQSSVVNSTLKDRINSPRILHIDFKVPSGLINSYLSEDRTEPSKMLSFIGLPQPIEEYPANVNQESLSSEAVIAFLGVSNKSLFLSMHSNDSGEQFIPIFDGSGNSDYAFNLDILSILPGFLNSGYFYLANVKETPENDNYEDNINYWSNWINALGVNKETYDLVIQSELNTGEKKWTKVEELNPLNLKSLEEYLLSYYDRKYYKEWNVINSVLPTELDETSGETIVLEERPCFGLNPDTHYDINYNSGYDFVAVLNRSFFSPNTISTEEYSINLTTNDSSIYGYLIFSDLSNWKSLTFIDYWNNESNYSTLGSQDCLLYAENWNIYNLLINNKKVRAERFNGAAPQD